MAEIDSGSDGDTSVGDKDDYLEVDKDRDEFAETIELIEVNAEEIDLQVSDSVSEVRKYKRIFKRTISCFTIVFG